MRLKYNLYLYIYIYIYIKRIQKISYAFEKVKNTPKLIR